MCGCLQVFIIPAFYVCVHVCVCVLVIMHELCEYVNKPASVCFDVNLRGMLGNTAVTQLDVCFLSTFFLTLFWTRWAKHPLQIITCQYSSPLLHS